MDVPEQTQDVGDLLAAQGKLSEKQLDALRRHQRRLRIPQHVAVLELNYASEEDTYRALAQLHRLEFVDLCTTPLAPETFELVSLKIVFDHRVAPLGLEEDCLSLAFCEPPKQPELANLRLLLGRRIKPWLTTPSGFHHTIKKRYGLGAATIQRLREDRGLTEGSQELVFDVSAGEAGGAVDASIARYVDEVLAEALRLQATDIHLEPYFAKVRLRYRIDGVMQEVPVPEALRPLYSAMVSRLKIMAALNIAEKRLPHDGRISMKTGQDEYDLRISVIPTKHGEAVCLRILGRQSLLLDFSQLGMEPHHESLFQELVRLPQGLVLLTGPTGSGKTTTLYAALANAKDDQRKIITIEDPIEYQLEGIVQIQTREEVGLTFSGGLRAVLRHDPDVVLIGEIRDAETAEIAVRAAQTGHLVFSTLHTNDSISALTRLLDMEIDPFLLGASLVCCAAQRLAQRICRHCSEPDTAMPEELRAEMAAALKRDPAAVRASRGAGCIECSQRGYRGRIAIYEFFRMTEEIADLLGPDLKTGRLRAAARRHGWRSLREEAWGKVQNGLISLSELQRLTRRLQLRGPLGGESTGD